LITTFTKTLRRFCPAFQLKARAVRAELELAREAVAVRAAGLLTTFNNYE
jgi:hypothetical protein